MTKKIMFGLFLLIIFVEFPATAQTYVGTVLYRNAYEYIKVQCKENACEFSIPYLDRNQKYPIQGALVNESLWEAQRGIENWKFNTVQKNGIVEGILQLPTGQQTILLKEQGKSLSKEQLSPYIGVYEDELKRKVIVYDRFDYLHIMSPYSEETNSLKPIGGNTFWSVSGEESEFSDLKNDAFQILKIVDRFGNQNSLKRIKAFKLEKLWIPIGEDTLYAQLYLPESSKKVPACLILPGGGPIGLENYEYEARFLAAYGIASLIFDKAGNGQSKGKNHFARQTFEEKNEQYKLLFKYLQNHSAIDAKKVGVHGPSEGGRLGLLMAIDLKEEVAFVNAVAAPLMTMREGQFYAMDQHHRILGMNEHDNMKIQQIWSDYYDGIMEGTIDSEIIERANFYRAQNERLFLPPDFAQIPASPNKYDIPNDRVVQEAEKITCPVLLQYGENDQRVHWQKSLQNFMPKVSKTENIQTIIYNRGSHSMMTPEYKICPGYVDDKIKWLKMIGILEIN